MPQSLDYYLLLGVKPNASHDQIKRAYRKKALACHPDRGGAVRDMQLLNEAWAVLGEPERRREYDAERAAANRAVVERKVSTREPAQTAVAEEPPDETVISEIGWVAQRLSFYLGKLIGALSRKPDKARKK